MLRESRYNVWSTGMVDHYVFNGLSGRLMQITPNQRAAVDRALSGAELVADDIGILERLVWARVLTNDSVDEIDVLRHRYQSDAADQSQLSLTLVTSLGCNFACTYCFEDKHPSILSPDVEQSVLRFVDAALPRLKGFDVTWFGGEPLLGLRPLLALSDEFIARCDQAGVEYQADIITNGWLLTSETSRKLAARRVTSAQVTLDGPPEPHDLLRPHVSGASTFWRIVENVEHALEHLEVSVRVNLGWDNLNGVEELMTILADRGWAGRVQLAPGHLTATAEYGAAPAGSFSGACLSKPEFARVEREFFALARQHGFAAPSLPGPTGTPCAAVRRNHYVVGSDGTLWTCWDVVGDPAESVGHIDDPLDPENRLAKWTQYDPFSDPECTQCKALPVCMGGCAHYSFMPSVHDNRCSSFRYQYQERVDATIHQYERGVPPPVPIELIGSAPMSPPSPQAVPVQFVTRARV